MGRLLNINGWQAIKIMLVLNKLCTKTRNIITLYGYFFYFFHIPSICCVKLHVHWHNLLRLDLPGIMLHVIIRTGHGQGQNLIEQYMSLGTVYVNATTKC